MGTPDPISISKESPLILFDGVCNLCSGSVQFIIKRDPKGKFRFASLQSSIGQQMLQKLDLSKEKLHSIIYIDGNYYERSDAALKIARHLKGLWPLLYGFKIIPRFMRDAVYNLIARNRYKLFGRKNECWLPAPELKSRFVE